jgi:glycosyltransferase involved in cell wall biosynthesis
MKVSLVIPFYQHERGLLARAVDSVVAQLLPPDCVVDIIVVDDGWFTSARDDTLVPC